MCSLFCRIGKSSYSTKNAPRGSAIARFEEVAFATETLCSFEEFVVDARNGFEDDKRDVEWGFQFLLPEMAKTSCQCVCFIMNHINDIQEEMDMWTLEFGKYFGVMKAETLEQAIEFTHHYVYADVKYRIRSGKREEFINRLFDEQIVDKSRQEPGNIKYEVCLPIGSPDEVCINELWVNCIEQKRHTQTEHYFRLTELKKLYVESVEMYNYQVKKN